MHVVSTIFCLLAWASVQFQPLTQSLSASHLTTDGLNDCSNIVSCFPFLGAELTVLFKSESCLYSIGVLRLVIVYSSSSLLTD